MTAPTFRSVDQHTGDIEQPAACVCPMYARDPKCPKDHSLEQALADARAELDDAMSQLRIVTDSNAGLAKFANVYHTERDEMRERADEYADRCKDYLATIDELEAEVRDLKRSLAAAESQRDTAGAAASL